MRPLKKRLLSLFSPLLRLFKMSQSPTSNPPKNPPEFIEIPLHILDYASRLPLIYSSLAHAERTKVESIQLYKASTGSQHEYIIVTVACDAASSDFVQGTSDGTAAIYPTPHHYICIQRSPGRGAGEGTGSASSLSLQSLPHATRSVDTVNSTTSSSSRSLQSIYGVPAADTVYWLAPGKHKQNHHDELVRTITFTKETPCYLFTIILLAVVIHRQYPSYTLFSQNCYFLAGVISGSLKGKITNEEDLPFYLRQGEWYGLFRTYPTPPANPERTIGEFSLIVNQHKENYENEYSQFKATLKEKEAERAQLTAKATERAMVAETALEVAEMEKAEKDRKIKEVEAESHRMIKEVEEKDQMIQALLRQLEEAKSTPARQ